jgi:hypothetical protein
MLDERVCPSCRVLLRDGTHTCPKCGRTVEAKETGLGFFDLPPELYSSLVRRFGHLLAVVVAVIASVILYAAWLFDTLSDAILSLVGK